MSYKINENFESLAHKLRMQKFDKKEILVLKNEAIMNEKIKNKRKKFAIVIQKFLRGFFLRKKFKIIIDEMNTNIVIEYFKDRRKQRIKQNAKKIILRNLNKYLDRKREVKKKIVIEYFNYCASMITKHLKGYIVRKQFFPYFEQIKFSKYKINSWINSYKIRLILRTNKLQDLLVEIANIQMTLSSLTSDQRNSDKTEKMKNEFKKRINKVYVNFYEEFYKLKRSRNWVNYNKTDKQWLQGFINLMTNAQTPINLFANNPKSNIYNESDYYNDRNLVDQHNEMDNHKENLKPKKVNAKKNNKKKVPAINEDNIQNRERDDSSDNLKEVIVNKCREKIEKKKSGKNNKEICENETNEVDHTNQNESFKENENINEVDSEVIVNPKGSEYDDKPIKVNPNKFLELLDKYPEIPTEKIEDNSQEIFETKDKKKKPQPIRRKPAKYDARKAIEEAASNQNVEKENNSNKKNDRDNFRKFLKEMRVEKDNTAPKTPDKNEQKNNKKIEEEEIVFETKNKAQGGVRGGIGGGAGGGMGGGLGGAMGGGFAGTDSYGVPDKSGGDKSPRDNKNAKKKDEEENTRRKKNANDVNLRKKLHELEKSPPPKLDIKNVKSKIDCWGSENIDPANLKKFKKIDEPNEVYNLKIVPEPELDNKIKVNEFFDNLENDYKSLKSYTNNKSASMERYLDICYIREDSFYIKHYSNEIYEELLVHLKKHYDELKN